MVFYTAVPRAAGMAGSEEGGAKYKFSVSRLLLAGVLFVALISPAYLARAAWPEGSATLLDLAKIVGGGIIGIILGEKGVSDAR
jgi:hypothetical protein